MQSTPCPRCGLSHPGAAACPIPERLPIQVADAPLAPGTLIGGRFRIQCLAHRSGMSTVYRATDARNVGELAAIKEFNASGLPADERHEVLAWLAREVGLLATLNHPRLPKLIAAFSEGDRHYVAMPFLQGETLEARLKHEGPQPESLVLGWTYDLAMLLEYLHAQDPPIIHRDLKPANVLLQPDGSLVLLDLGVARSLMPPDGAMVRAGTAVGTPGYAPPEQYQGLAETRSDLYGLGATMHRLLTGYDAEHQPPFRQPDVRDLRSTAGAGTATLLGDLLQLAPERRPAHAALVAARARNLVQQVHCRPLFAMYRQMLVLIAAACLLGVAAYRWAIGGLACLPHDGRCYMMAGTSSNALRVALVFLPGLLPFLPLFHPAVLALLRRDAALRAQHQRLAWSLLGLWLLPFVLWLLDLTLTVGDDRLATAIAPARTAFTPATPALVVMPGQAPFTMTLAYGAAVLAAIAVLRQHYRLRRLRIRMQRLPWYGVAIRFGGLVALWFGLLMAQMLTIFGMN